MHLSKSARRAGFIGRIPLRVNKNYKNFDGQTGVCPFIYHDRYLLLSSM